MNGSAGRFSNLEINSGRKAETRRGGAPLRDVAYYLNAGLRSELAGDHEQALTHYSAALGENPLFVEAWVAQIWMLLYLQEPIEAHLWADRALENFPNQPDLLAVKSISLMRCGLLTEARELNDAALVKGRESANVWLARGNLQILTDGRAAAACFQHALAVPAANRGLVNLRIGDIYLYQRKFAEAEIYLREASLLLPEAAWVWYGYGLALRALGRDDAALAALTRAAGLAPQEQLYRLALKEKRGWLAGLRGWLGRPFGRE